MATITIPMNRVNYLFASKMRYHEDITIYRDDDVICMTKHPELKLLYKYYWGAIQDVLIDGIPLKLDIPLEWKNLTLIHEGEIIKSDKDEIIIVDKKKTIT